MASNYTEKYHLSQWAASDPVLREDFNADNAKIEAALAGLREIIISANILEALFDQHAKRLTNLETRLTAAEKRIDTYHGE